jgi:hypothetical protein
MNLEFDITGFIAEINGQSYKVKAKGFSVVLIDKDSSRVAEELRLRYMMLNDEIQFNSGLRHCDSGYAFARMLKDEYGARIWNIKRYFYPTRVVF